MKTKAPALATVYGTSPDLPKMEKMIGEGFLCGTVVSLVASPDGGEDAPSHWEVHNSKGKTSLVVVRMGKRFAFGTVAK